MAFHKSPRSGRPTLTQRFIAGADRDFTRSPRSGRLKEKTRMANLLRRVSRPFHGLPFTILHAPSSKLLGFNSSSASRTFCAILRPRATSQDGLGQGSLPSYFSTTGWQGAFWLWAEG